MAKNVVLVGHCGPDSSYLRMVVRQAAPEAQVSLVDDQAELDRVLAGGVDLVLFNRELNYGFTQTLGVDLIRALRGRYPALRMMLVSNYPDAQQAAEQAGALPGFGKREIGSPRVVQVLREAIEPAQVPSQSVSQ